MSFVVVGGDTTSPKGSPAIGKVIEECYAAKIAANRRPRYVKGLRAYLRLFAKGREHIPISEFTVSTLEEWFTSRGEKPASRRGNIARLSSVFGFARRRRYIQHNPCSDLEHVQIDHRPPRIFTPVEAEQVIRFFDEHHRRRLPAVVLGMFCGIRPAELHRLFWKDIDLERGLVRIDAAASKIRKRRIVPIPENAQAWLRRCIPNARPIGARGYKWLAKLKREARFLWDQDILRHTAASYTVARFEDVGKVSRWLGNSPDVLLRHYTELVSREDCSAFWSIAP